MANGLNGFCVRGRIKTLGRFSAGRGHKEGTGWRYPNNELCTQKVNLALPLSLSYNTRTRGLVMRAKGSAMKAIKENKYLHERIINLWSEFPQEPREAKSLVGFRRGLGFSVDNGNIWSRVGWCGKSEGTLGQGQGVCKPSGKWQHKFAQEGRKFHYWSTNPPESPSTQDQECPEMRGLN